MRFRFSLFLLLLLAVSHVQGQTLVSDDSNSFSFATGHIYAAPDYFDMTGPEHYGNGSTQHNRNNTGSAAAAGGSDGNADATGSIALSTEGFALPNQVTAGAGLIGQLWSHYGSVTVSDNVPPMVNDPVGASGVDADGDGIDDAIDASILVGVPVPIIRPDANGNGIDDDVEALPGLIAPAMPGANGAEASTNTRGVYFFNRPPAPQGFVWVASGSYMVNIGAVNSIASASVGNPAVNASVDNMTGAAVATVVDVLGGITKNIYAEGAEGIAGSWSIVVGVGPENQFEQNASVSVTTEGTADYGNLINLGGAATANIEIENVVLMEVATIPPMVVVNDGMGGTDDGMGGMDDGMGGMDDGMGGMDDGMGGMDDGMGGMDDGMGGMDGGF